MTPGARRSPSPGGRHGAGSSARTSAERLIARGWDVVGLDNLLTGRMENIDGAARHARSSRSRATTSRTSCTSTGAVDAVLHFASPASPLDYLEHPIKTLKVGSLGTHNTLGLALAKGARFLLASTSEVYGDPQVHPQPESYWGNVNPVGPRGVYDEAKRFAEALTLAYHRATASTSRIVRIFNTYGPRLRPGRRAGGVELPRAGDARASRSPSTATASRRGRSATSTTRSAGSSRCSTPTTSGPMNIGNPNEFTILRAGRRPCSTSPGRARRSCSSRCPIDDPDAAPARHHACARERARLGARGRAPRGARPAPTSGTAERAGRRVAGGADAAETADRGTASCRSSCPSSTSATPSWRSCAGCARSSCPIDREFVVVDDGSDDGTRAVLTPARRQHGQGRDARREPGKGAAIRTGLEHVTGDLVLIQDADLEYDPEDWPQAARAGARGQRDVSSTARASPASAATCCSCTGSATGSCRSSPTCSTTRRSPTWRRATSCSTAVCSTASTSSPTGSTSSPRSRPRCCASGIRIYEVPISYAGREFDEGKKITWRDGFTALWTLVKYRFVD